MVYSFTLISLITAINASMSYNPSYNTNNNMVNVPSYNSGNNNDVVNKPSYNSGNNNMVNKPSYNSGNNNKGNTPNYNTVNKPKYTTLVPTPIYNQHRPRPKPRPSPRPKPTMTPSEPAPPTQPSEPSDNPAPIPSGDGGNYDERTKQMLCQVNAIRSQAGKKPYKLDSRLNKAAQLHSEDQAAHKRMSHTGTKIASFFDRIKAAGFSCQGGAENVAWNQKDVTEVVKAWKNSSGHYANMVGNYECFGWGEKDLYWTQNFASGAACDQTTEIQC